MALLDDDDAFEAALSFLDEYDALHDVHGSFEGQAAPTPPQIPARQRSLEDKLRRKKEFNERRKMLRRTGVYGDPNRSRNERKKEIAFLREQLQKLQLDRQALQSKAAEQTDKEEETAGQSGEETALVPRVWREMAGRQRKRRREAESENIRLKVVVEQQQKVADSLRSLLRKRAAQLEKEYSAFTDPAFSGHYVDRVLDFRGDIGEFQGLFRHLDSARLELDTMLAANGLANMTISPIDVHIREGFNGKYMEFFTFKELPFGLQDTQEVAWDHWKGMEKHIMGNGGLYQKTAKNVDQPYTIVEDFTKELFSNSARADVQRSSTKCSVAWHTIFGVKWW
ncbi:M96 mating-specific protein family [Phytophthora cinnamomi]|uniref:M96 mating-specific protein family n=1 Tax=Phytophthora cinnamomi TaxID=4785 RepID=UPI003559FFFC|nr:M96 mating-specific protein family [Phytophthora cinnamomi]